MTTNNISFGSTYVAYIKSNPNGSRHHEVQEADLRNHLADNDIPYQDSLPSYMGNALKDSNTITRYTILAPNSKDADVETFCASRGIDFVRLNSRIAS